MAASSPTDRRKPGFSFLLAGMFAELIVAPFFGRAPNGLVATRAIGVLLLLAALSVVGLGGTALVLFIPTLIAQVLAIYSTAPSAMVAATTARCVFLCYVVGAVVWHVSRARTVTLDTIAGATCAYMLLGLVWASLYQLVEYVRPGSFLIPSSWLPANRNPQAALTYFSFVTLATVGYGDVRPADVDVGGLCVAEALVGQLYLAVMIARMVSLHIAQRAD